MEITRRFTLVIASTALLGFGIGCAQPVEQKPSAPDLAAIEASIRSLDKDWSDAAGAKDLDKSTMDYADDGQFLSPGDPSAVGKDAIRKAWAGLFAAPGYVSLTFAPTTVHVAEAGDVAYEIGNYELIMKDKKGKPATTKGKFVVVWKKQADGSWKVEADIFNQGV